MPTRNNGAGLGERGTRQDIEVRRRALIAATLESLAAGGLAAVSVRDVAARAGVSIGLVRYHFGSFGALLVEAYRHTTHEIDARLAAAVEAAGPSPRRRMEAFLQASFAADIVDRDLLSAWLGFWGLVRSDPNAAALHAETYGAYRGRIEALLADLATEAGRKADAAQGAMALAAMLDGLWLERCLDPPTFSPEAAVGMTRRWVDGFLATAEPA